MSRHISTWKAFAMLAFLGSVGFAQITPYNSWRALIVYTNSADSSFQADGISFYKDHFVSLFDGINQTYEDSEIETRAQIAGVIWDKTYAEMHPVALPPFGNIAGCGSTDDILFKRNGMKRYVDLLSIYAADAIILVHQNAGGGYGACAITIISATDSGYGGFWANPNTTVSDWAHEMGHTHGAGHHNGHRITVDASGNIVNSGDSINNTGAVRGFHTTMAYGSGGGDVRYDYALNKNVGFQGQRGIETAWSGKFSNPNLTWTDTVTNIAHPLGVDPFYASGKFYFTFLGPRDTTLAYPRDVSAMHQANGDTIRNLKGMPSTLTVTSSMSLGETSSDSQWVYANFVATNTIIVEPGFRVAPGSSAKFWTGSSGMLGKRASEFAMPGPKLFDEDQAEIDFQIHYQSKSGVVHFSFSGAISSRVSIEIFDIKGGVKPAGPYKFDGNLSSGSINVGTLPKGVYLLRATTSSSVWNRRFINW